MLAALVIGSGIMAAQLSQDPGLQLAANAAATAAGLFAIILIFGPVSGAHLNPVVSLVDAACGGLSRRDAAAYIPLQIAGCITGAIAANAMFALDAVSISTHHRASPAHQLGEVIATAGLILVIFALVRSGRAPARRPPSAPTSAPPTSSPAPPASPTPRSPSAGSSQTPSPVEHPLLAGFECAPLRAPRTTKAAAQGANSRSCATAFTSGDGGCIELRNPGLSREVRRGLLLSCSPPGEREAHLVAHTAFGRVPVEALHERAAVGVAELVGDDVRRQPALHEERGAGMAELVQLQALSFGPALTHHAEVVRQRAF
jgi:hypothetical protein